MHTLQAPLKMLGKNLPLLKSVRVLLLSSVALHLAAASDFSHSELSDWLGYLKGVGGKKLSRTNFSTNKITADLFSI